MHYQVIIARYYIRIYYTCICCNIAINSLRNIMNIIMNIKKDNNEKREKKNNLK